MGQRVAGFRRSDSAANSDTLRLRVAGDDNRAGEDGGDERSRHFLLDALFVFLAEDLEADDVEVFFDGA